MFDSTPDIDQMIRDSGVPVFKGPNDEEGGYGIVDLFDEDIYDTDLLAFFGRLTKVTTRTSAWSEMKEGDLLSFQDGVHRVVRPKLRSDGEIQETLVAYVEPAIMNQAAVQAIIADTVQPALYVKPGDGLQAAVNALDPIKGGTITIADAPYYADPLFPSLGLLVDRPVEFLGLHQGRSGIWSPVLVTCPRVGFRKLSVQPPFGAYGIRIFNNGNFVARCWFEEVYIGATNPLGTDGPAGDGLQLDGAGVLWGKHLTIANCGGNGLLVDSTGAQPNTTLDFNSCTFNLNGLFGVKLMQSLTVASFKGGNMEDNGMLMSGTSAREFYAESAASIHIEHVDFERGDVVGYTVPSSDEMIEMENCNSVVISKNNFQNSNSKATRAFFLAGCAGGEYELNRLSGWGAVGVVRIGETCQNIRQGVNHIFSGGGWIEDYSH